jgi:hypothetical protein
MLRKTLLITTALVFGASVAYAGHKNINLTNSKAVQKLLAIGHTGNMAKGVPAMVITSKRGTHPVHNVAPHFDSAIFSNFSKNANAQFISWYGYRAENASSCYTSSIYHSCFSLQADNALAFKSGVTATTKKTSVAMFSFSPSATYAVNVYSDAGGLPGAVLATSHTLTDSDTSLCCTAARTVAIHANLTAGTTYFLGLVGSSVGSNGGWNMEDTDITGASVDYYHFKEHITYGTVSGPTYSSNYSSPWHASTYLPEVGVASLK